MRKILLFLILLIFSCEYSGKYLKTGDQYCKEGNFAAAILEYGKAEAINPHNTTIFLHRGKALERLGLYDSAAIDFQKNLTYDAENAEAMGHLAWCWYSTTPPKREECRIQMKKALEIDPDLSELWYLYGKMNFHSNDLKNAEIALKKAISLDKNDTDAKGLLTRVLERNQQLAEALPLVNEVLQSDPNNAEATHVASVISRSKGQFELASRQANRAHFLDPSFPSYVTNISEEKPIQTETTDLSNQQKEVNYQLLNPDESSSSPNNISIDSLLITTLHDDSDTILTLDFPTDTTFEQLLLRMMDLTHSDSSKHIDVDSSINPQIPFDTLGIKDTVNPIFIPDSLPETDNDSKTKLHSNIDSIVNPSKLNDHAKGSNSEQEMLNNIRNFIIQKDYQGLDFALKDYWLHSYSHQNLGYFHLLTGVTYHRMGKTSDALIYFKKASQLLPLSKRLFIKEGIIAFPS